MDFPTSMADAENPILKARPPATDYLTYLTILEYNLNTDNLHILHDVLQDQTLTVNIGWDLVHLLIPLVPAPGAEQCLQDITRLGNPREVILKVTESLRQLEFDHGERSPSSDYSEIGGSELPEKKNKPTGEDRDGESSSPLPQSVSQFMILLSMLSILHPRIKTKYPSRFLSTSLQAILTTIRESPTHKNELTAAVVTFIKTVSGTRRPHLPPRRSTAQSQTLASMQQQKPAPDPEEHPEQPSADEDALQLRLFQAFVTHLLEDYVQSLSEEHGATSAGLAWSSRLWEKLHPEKLVPGKKTFTQRFSERESSQLVLSTVGQIVALAQDLDIGDDTLRGIITAKEDTAETAATDEPPASAEDIPLSKSGAIYIFTARQVSEKLYDSPRTTSDFSIFPDHCRLLLNHLEVDNPALLGSEPPSQIDAILALGLIAVEETRIGQAGSDDDRFLRYLQTLSLISAETPVPELRFFAHHLTSAVLHAHPSDLVRLTFIRDTLEHCPFENLKESAVSWLKQETLAAVRPPAEGAAAASSSTGPSSGAEESAGILPSPYPPSIFAGIVALLQTAPFLFPDLSHLLAAETHGKSAAQSSSSAIPAPDPSDHATRHLQTSITFHIAALNFLYLVLSAPHLRTGLDVQALFEAHDIVGMFLVPLKQIARQVRNNLEKDAGGSSAVLVDDDDDDIDGGFSDAQLGAEIRILEDAIARVEESMDKLEKEGFGFRV